MYVRNPAAKSAAPAVIRSFARPLKTYTPSSSSSPISESCLNCGDIGFPIYP
jgi:hypothetical protein